MYAHVEEGTLTRRGDLPKNWRNVSGLDLADDATLKSLGWLPYSEVAPALGDNEMYDGETLSITADAVVSTKITRALTPDEFLSLQADAKIRLKARRYQAETSGTVIGGSSVDTDRDTQAKLIAARVMAKEDASYTINWKLPAGFVVLDATTIIAIADGVRTHVQNCFDNEAALTTAIDLATTTTALDAVDIESGW